MPNAIGQLTDKDFDEMVKVEKRIEQKKKKNNYREKNIKCCLTCEYSNTGSDGCFCLLLDDRRWTFNIVEPLGICDKYVKYMEA